MEDKYTWLTNKETIEKSEAVGSGIINLDLTDPSTPWENKTFNFIGIYSKNTINYLICDLACTMYDFTLIPIYDTLGEDATLFAFN